jgi:hypothetical protein
METKTPKLLTDKRDREMARRMRDGQWAFADRVAAQGTVWVCWWNKNRHGPSPSAQYADGSGYRDDLLVCGLIDGMELAAWLHSHEDWWVIGEWSDERYAAPVSLTDAGRVALANREAYDMEPIEGGLAEPGWQAIPTERTADTASTLCPTEKPELAKDPKVNQEKKCAT